MYLEVYNNEKPLFISPIYFEFRKSQIFLT
jgi:hypothetical protein